MRRWKTLWDLQMAEEHEKRDLTRNQREETNGDDHRRLPDSRNGNQEAATCGSRPCSGERGLTRDRREAEEERMGCFGGE
ncbi:hypothetical protein NDU88_001550 [Pleurodeles waltl]|uniref:Uncharacterized protein n=1 Tax=Pleurodeles waltl TaxID=8319 RepID=A0AAV7U6S2_PLEWA|nr:hypothetical protein NDU88_001550 [Pleurodeles waltl]